MIHSRYLYKHLITFILCERMSKPLHSFFQLIFWNGSISVMIKCSKMKILLLLELYVNTVSILTTVNLINCSFYAKIFISMRRYQLNKMKKKRQLTSFQDHVEVMDFSGWNYFFCYKLNKMRHVKAHLPFFYHYTSLKYKRKKIITQVMYCNGFVLFLISFMLSEFKKVP